MRKIPDAVFRPHRGFAGSASCEVVGHWFERHGRLSGGDWKDYFGKVCGCERRAGVGCRNTRPLPALALPGDEGLLADAVAEVEGVQQLLALGRREAQSAVAAGADDGVGGGRVRMVWIAYAAMYAPDAPAWLVAVY